MSPTTPTPTPSSAPIPAARQERPGLLERAGVLAYLPPDPELRHNAARSLLDGMAYSVMPGFFDPFRSVFAIALGASDYMLGLLAALPSVTAMLGQAVGAVLANRSRRRLPVVVTWAFAHRLFFLLFAALPFLPVGRPIDRAWIFVAAVGLMNLPASVTGLAWTSLMQKLFPPEYRGQVFGERNALLGAVTITATAIGGWLLAVIRFPFNYAVLNFASFAFLMLSLYYLTTLRELDGRPGEAGAAGSAPNATAAARTDAQTAAESRGRSSRASLWSSLARLRRNRAYARFVAAMIVLQFGLNMPAALYPVLLVRELHISTFWIGLMATGGGLSAVLTYRFWGRFSDRHGHRATLTLTALVWPAGCLAYAFIHAPWSPALIELTFSAVTAGYNLSLFNYLLELSPPEECPTYIAVYNIATSLVVLAAPLVGVWVMSFTGVRPALAVSAGARLAGVALLWVLVRGRRRPEGRTA